jgi:hypothetical protein
MNISVKVTCQSNGWNKQNKHIDYSISNIFFLLFFILLLDTFTDIFYFAHSLSRKRESLWSTKVIHTIIYYGFVVMCFLIGKKTLLKTYWF